MKMKINFTKMHGLGNDYIYIDATKEKFPDIDFSKLARILSDRHFGIGSDGIILIKDSETCDFRMQMFNSDGSEAQMCGNGIRCVGKYVYDKGLTKKKRLNIETKAGVKKLVLKVDSETNTVTSVTVNMGDKILDPKLIPCIPNSVDKKKVILTSGGRSFAFSPISMGNPHAVTFVNDLDNFNVEKYGKNFECSRFFPERSNIEFVEVINKGEIKMRVWERGAGETLACGTGACAAACICYLEGKTGSLVTVDLLGGKLTIRIMKDHILMTGSATTVFEGEVEVDI